MKPTWNHIGNVFDSSLELLAASIVLLSRTRATRIESDDDGNLVAMTNIEARITPKGCRHVGVYRYANQRPVRNDLIELAAELAREEDAELDAQAGAAA